MRARRTQDRVILLTRRYGGEVTATTSRLRAYVNALRNEGAEVLVITRFPFVHAGRNTEERYRNRWYMRERIDGVPVIRVRIAGNRFLERWLDRMFRLRPTRGRSFTALEIIELLYGLLALPLIAVLRPRVVVVEQGPPWLALPMWFLGRLGTRLVLQVSDIKSLAMERGLYGAVPAARVQRNRRLEDLSYRGATAIVTVTEALQTNIAQRVERNGREVYLIPNGAEVDLVGQTTPDEKDSSKQRLGLGGKFVVLYAGTFSASHDLQTLLDAAKHLADVPDIAFLLLGEGPSELELSCAAKERGLNNVVFRRGVPITMLSAFVAAADAGVSTEIGGLRETVRSKIYLYMAGRLPIIVTDDGGESRALVTRAESGYLVPPGNGGAIAERLLELKRRPDLAAALGENGRRFVERYHDRAQLAERFARVVLRHSRGSEGREAPDGRLYGSAAEADSLPEG